MKSLINYFIYASIFLSTIAYAIKNDTEIQKRKLQILKLNTLEKLTVGPDDQYKSIFDQLTNNLFYLQRSNMTSKLVVQNLGTGKITSLVGDKYDVDDFDLLDSKNLVYVSFKNSAAGEICFAEIDFRFGVKLIEENNKCISKSSKEFIVKSPLWKSSSEIIYLLTNRQQSDSRVMIYNKDTGIHSVIVEGNITHIQFSKKWNSLVYVKIVDQKTQLNLLKFQKIKPEDSGELRTEHSLTFNLKLPGLTTFPAFSEDGSYVYLSQYLTDSNHDGVIDARDRSTIYRLSATRRDDPAVQITSELHNCSYPSVSDKLYLTCDFEGSLDIYRIDLDGEVPAGLSQEQMLEIYASSRTYQERLLILNALFCRYHFLDIDNPWVISNLLHLKDYSQSIYLNSQKDLGMHYYLSIMDASNRYRTKDDLSEFKLRLHQFKEEIKINSKKIKGQVLYFLNKLIDSFLNLPNISDFDQVVKKDTHFDSVITEFLQVNTHEIAWLKFAYLEFLTSFLNSTDKKYQYKIYDEVVRILNSVKDIENQAYLTQFLLGSIASLQLNDRIATLQNMRPRLPQQVQIIVEAELLILKLIHEKQVTLKREIYKSLDFIYMGSKNNLFVKRAIYTRAILNCLEGEEFDYLSIIGATWIKYVKRNGAEFLFALEFVNQASLNEAYQRLYLKQSQLAENYFYSALSVTDDLESHYGYASTLANRLGPQKVKESYNFLLKQNATSENHEIIMNFLELRDYLEDPKHPLSKINNLLSNLSQKSNQSPIFHLLLGMGYLQKLFKIQSEKGHDQEWGDDVYQRSHFHLNLAYDLSRERPNVAAQALLHLGILHQKAGNHGKAIAYFQKRKNYGFRIDQDQMDVALLLARSYFFLYDYNRAHSELSEVINLKTQPQPYVEFIYGFYLLLDHNNDKAKTIFKKIEKSFTQNGFFYLFLGVIEGRLGNSNQALEYLSRSREIFLKYGVREKYGGQYNLDRQLILIDGFLANYAVGKLKVEYLNRRLQLLRKNSKSFLEASTLIAQGELQLFESCFKSNEEVTKCTNHLLESWKLISNKISQEQLISNSDIIVMWNYFALASPDYKKYFYSKTQMKNIEKILNKQIEFSPQIIEWKSKTEKLWIHACKVYQESDCTLNWGLELPQKL